MRDISVNLFTCGDAGDINTWSNVPYYFHRGLLAQKVRVKPLDLTPSGSLNFRLFCRLWNVRKRVAAKLHLALDADLFRTETNCRLTNRKLAAAIRENGSADLNVFMTFSFSSYKCAETPVVHYCDRTYEHHLEETGTIPTTRDRAFIQIERDNLEHAALVLTMSQLCGDFIRSRYRAKQVMYLRGGINADVTDVDAAELIAYKLRHKDILFIGRGAYKRGVDILIKAFRVFNALHDGQFALHIVGITPQELPGDLHADLDNIHLHGYLNRNIGPERNLYNELLRRARLFVFPMRPGPVAGVLREAQLNCTPILVSKVPGTSERVRHDTDGILVDSFEPEEFARNMDVLVADEVRWRRLAHGAHLAARDNTWSKTAENFLRIAKSAGLVNSVTA